MKKFRASRWVVRPSMRLQAVGRNPSSKVVAETLPERASRACVQRLVASSVAGVPGVPGIDDAAGADGSACTSPSIDNWTALSVGSSENIPLSTELSTDVDKPYRSGSTGNPAP